MTRISGGAAALLVLLFIMGCGENNQPAEGVDHDADTALEIKARTLSFVEAWQNDPDEAQYLLEGLSEQVAAYESFPTGGYRDIYQQLDTLLQEIQANYQQADAAQIEKLRSTAEELPGDPSELVLYE